MQNNSVIPFLKVFGGFLLMITFGALQIWGNVSIYIVSWIRLEYPSLQMAKSFALVPVAVVFLYGLLPFSVAIGNKIGLVKTSIIGAMLLPAGFFVSSLFQNFFALVLFFGIIPCFTIGVGYMIPLKVCWEIFPNAKGKVAGILFSGNASSALIFNFVTSMVVNPTNLPPDIEVKEGDVITKYYSETVANRVPLMLIVYSLSILVIGLTGAIFVHLKYSPAKSEEEEVVQEGAKEAHEKTPGEDVKQPILAQAENNDIVPQGNTETEKGDEVAKDVKEQGKSGSIKDFVFSKRFLLLTAIFLSHSMYTIFMILYYKQLGLLYISDDYFLATSGSLFFLVTCLAKPLWGTLLDSKGYILTSTLLIVLEVIISGTFTLVLEWESTYLIFMALAGVTSAGTPFLIPTYTARIWGTEVGTQLSSIMFFTNLITYTTVSLTGVALGNIIGLVYLEIIFFGCACLAFIINFYYIRNYED